MYKRVSFLVVSLLTGCSSTDVIDGSLATYEISGSWQCEGVGDPLIELSYHDHVVYKDNGSFQKLSKINFRFPGSNEFNEVEISSNGTWKKSRNSLTENNLQFTVEVDDKFPKAYLEQFKTQMAIPEQASWSLKFLSKNNVLKESVYGQKITCKKALQ